ncbi:MAG: TlpA family protein disulfide reductase [Gemmatimonadetes bacterium]|nr:TlpA family protein disulfide reductase [Gemmatimonadota bacterium]MYK51109.1 TlpA family protein disulfide reductase [Gemmatimonadota bacterium]
MISISPIFRKNSILAGLFILFSLSVHSTLFGISNNAQDSSDDPSVARFDSANMDEVVIPLERVPVSAQALSRFRSSSIDFHDHGWISRKPLEEGLRGFPPGTTIEFYGVFELSALQLCILYYQEETDRKLWEPYDLEVPVDSKVSFVNGRDRNGNAVFLFDTNNNEDFSDEHAIYPENFGTVFRLLSYILPGRPSYGQKANATVEFEYNDGRIAKTQKVGVEVHRYTQYVKKQKDPTFPKFRGSVTEYRKGRVKIDGQLYDLAIYNKGRFATYSTKIYNRILWDLDHDGIFGSERESPEYYDADKPFNIGGITFEVKSISASGDEIILRKSDVSVPTKIEIERGSVAPDFAVTDIDGKNLQLSNFRGKYVLLDFWSTGCGPCVKDTPRLKALSEKFDRDNFEIIGVSSDTRRYKVENYVEKSHIGWPQILDAIDNNNKVSKMYNIGGLPHYVLIDRQGKVMMTNRSFRVALTLISPLL